MSIPILGLEIIDDNHSLQVVGVTRYSIKKVMRAVRVHRKSNFTYYRIFDGDIPFENNERFWYNDKFVDRYTSQMSDSYDIWMPSEFAPLIINHLKQDLRILIAPIRNEF